MTQFSVTCDPTASGRRVPSAQAIFSLLMVLLLVLLPLAGCSSSAPESSAQPSAGALDALPVTESDQSASAAPAKAVTTTNESAPAAQAAAAPAEEIAIAPTAEETSASLDALLPLSRTTNILVLGSDRRPNTPNWRTDVMMIVALDYENNRAGVISIPRDIFIDRIPDHNPNKINVVDYLGEQDEPDGGGPKLLGSIIQEKLGIPIHHYVRFDFNGFVELVDALGGVEVEIDCPYYDYFQIEDVVLNVKPGIQVLSGEEALVYVRSRRLGGDLDRARRQQRFIWAIRNHVLNENILTKLPALYSALGDSVQTDLGIVQILRVARFALGLDKENIHGFVIGYPLVRQGYAGAMWVFLADWDAIREEAQKVFEREPFIDTNTLENCP